MAQNPTIRPGASFHVLTLALIGIEKLSLPATWSNGPYYHEQHQRPENTTLTPSVPAKTLAILRIVHRGRLGARNVLLVESAEVGVNVVPVFIAHALADPEGVQRTVPSAKRLHSMISQRDRRALLKHMEFLPTPRPVTVRRRFRCDDTRG